jgi:hypothetical protein
MLLMCAGCPISFNFSFASVTNQFSVCLACVPSVLPLVSLLAVLSFNSAVENFLLCIYLPVTLNIVCSNSYYLVMGNHHSRKHTFISTSNCASYTRHFLRNLKAV